jgi:hypothetical protein
MIVGTEQVSTEEHSLPRMSDGEDNDDLYDSDSPYEESERDEDSPQGSRVDICWLTNSDPTTSTSSVITSLVPTSTVVTNSPNVTRMDSVPVTAPTNSTIDALFVNITETELVIQDLETVIDGNDNGGGQLSSPHHKQVREHLLNRQRKIISQRQQLDKLQSACMLRHTKANRKVIVDLLGPPSHLKIFRHMVSHPYVSTTFSCALQSHCCK